jgi:serine/threonine protein kinase
LSGNPIGSLSNVSSLSSLLHLYVLAGRLAGALTKRGVWFSLRRQVADASVATLENLSFPSSVTTLNFSSNPITLVRGVIFPASLTELTLLATANAAAATTTSTVSARALQTSVADPSAQAVSVLQEFEVRQSDADLFETLAHWEVSATSTLSCSDASANPRYVQDTMLCVLSDSEFAAKFESVVIEASSGSTSGSMWGADSTASQEEERIALQETLHQRRSWFLIGTAALLSAFTALLFVNAFCLCLRRKVQGASKQNGSQHKRTKTASGNNDFRRENARLGAAEEARHLLTSDPSARPDEHLPIQPESEPSAQHDEAPATRERKDDPVARLQGQLHRCELDKALIRHRELLSPAALEQLDAAGDRSRESSSAFIYFRAAYQDKTVMLKALSIAKHKRGSHSSSAPAELLGFVEEIRLSSELSHPQLVAFYGFVRMDRFTEETGDSGVAMVMEYMDRGDLNTFIQAHRQASLHQQVASKRRPDQRADAPKRVGWDDEALDDLMTGDGSDDDYEEDILRSDDERAAADDPGRWNWRSSSTAYKSKLSVAIEVAQAVRYLHSFSPPLFHGNLSSRKVFLNGDWSVKLGDLTCCSALRRWSSSHKQHSVASSSSTAASPARVSGASRSSSQASGEEVHMDMTVWTAPEVLDGRQYTQKADIYSFGVLLAQLASYECSSAEHSVMDDTEVPMLNNTHEEHSTADGEAPTPVRLLMFRCQAFQPEVRPTADELVQELHRIEQNLTGKSSA